MSPQRRAGPQGEDGLLIRGGGGAEAEVPGRRAQERKGKGKREVQEEREREKTHFRCHTRRAWSRPETRKAPEDFPRGVSPSKGQSKWETVECPPMDQAAPGFSLDSPLRRLGATAIVLPSHSWSPCLGPGDLGAPSSPAHGRPFWCLRSGTPRSLGRSPWSFSFSAFLGPPLG